MIFVHKPHHKRISSSTNLKLWKNRKINFCFLGKSIENITHITIHENDELSNVTKAYQEYRDLKNENQMVMLTDTKNGKKFFFDGKHDIPLTYSKRGGQIDEECLLAAINFFIDKGTIRLDKKKGGNLYLFAAILHILREGLIGSGCEGWTVDEYLQFLASDHINIAKTNIYDYEPKGREPENWSLKSKSERPLAKMKAFAVQFIKRYLECVSNKKQDSGIITEL